MLLKMLSRQAIRKKSKKEAQQLLKNLLGQNVPQSELNKIKISSQNLTIENDISDEVLSNINQNFLDCTCTSTKKK